MHPSSVMELTTNSLSLRRTSLLTILFVLAFSIIAIEFANAQARKRSIPWVRDAEIESLMRDYANPLFKAGGLRERTVDIFLLNRRDFNAFVTGTNMFMHTGAIMLADTPNEIIGVIAHETGHIIRGHITGLRDRVKKRRRCQYCLH